MFSPQVELAVTTMLEAHQLNRRRPYPLLDEHGRQLDRFLAATQDAQ